MLLILLWFGGQKVQKENIINSLIILSVSHDITFYIISCTTLRTENEACVGVKGLSRYLKKKKQTFSQALCSS